jgi:hypothetical protein
MQQHARSIIGGEIYYRSFGPRIPIMALQVGGGDMLKIGTYFTAILERTSDLRHQEQTPHVHLYVVVNTEEVKVTGKFIDFNRFKDKLERGC